MGIPGIFSLESGLDYRAENVEYSDMSFYSRIFSKKSCFGWVIKTKVYSILWWCRSMNKENAFKMNYHLVVCLSPSASAYPTLFLAFLTLDRSDACSFFTAYAR